MKKYFKNLLGKLFEIGWKESGVAGEWAYVDNIVNIQLDERIKIAVQQELKATHESIREEKTELEKNKEKIVEEVRKIFKKHKLL